DFAVIAPCQFSRGYSVVYLLIPCAFHRWTTAVPKHGPQCRSFCDLLCPTLWYTPKRMSAGASLPIYMRRVLSSYWLSVDLLCLTRENLVLSSVAVVRHNRFRNRTGAHPRGDSIHQLFVARKAPRVFIEVELI